ncbi:type IV secretion system lipoprotein VirB7 [Acidocella facilis]|uniref:type IV secretion system lipoprotein VirB7 n=1 Tax=Acidocella facilis TaxID=525 RepID=UPI0038D11901
MLRAMLVVATFVLLAGCSNGDPLAVASGPLFPLNVGLWQPTAHDLATPPAAVDR